MKWDTILTIINAIATVIAVISAIRSRRYYKKSRVLVEHTNMNKALVEIEKMLLKLPEALLATNKSRQKSGRGYNLEKVICNIGTELSSSYIEIHSCVPSEYAENLFVLENTGSFQLLKYINGYMSGDALVEDTLNSAQYTECQTQLMKMQDYIKKNVDAMLEKI